ncbi:MAG: thiopurine S-methyltransferase [Pseudomonadota bacterium]|nr:MAG: thiopurine S-methyltransferase [Pseudomonadota bacterium]
MTDKQFWTKRWQENRIGFHEGRVNRYLREYWQRLDAPPDQSVFVPLCGKAVDLAWLHERGHRVIGVELSKVACRGFFTDRGIEPTVTETGAFVHYSSDGIELLCGDFIDLTRGHLQGASLFYDRAALIALPEHMRPRYCDHLAEIAGPDARGLLITLDYPQQAFAGPPFAVPDSEVHRHLGRHFAVEALYHAPIQPDDPLRERGLSQATESVFSLSRR